MPNFKLTGNKMLWLGSAAGIGIALLHTLFFTFDLPGQGLFEALSLPALFLGYLTGIFVFLANGICGAKPYGAGDAIDLPPCHANVDFILIILGNAIFYGFVFWAIWRLVPLIKASRKQHADIYLGAKIGLLAGIAFDLIFLTGLVRIPEAILILPALPFMLLKLDFLFLGPFASDNQVRDRLVLFLYLSWPVIATSVGILVTYIRGKLKSKSKPHA